MDLMAGRTAASRLARMAQVAQVCHEEWNFHERVDRERGVITHWIQKDRISKKAQGSLERAMDQLRPLPIQQWTRPHASKIRGDNTYVIRFVDVARVQLRVFGHFYTPHTAFVMTETGIEKDNVYTPENYEDLATSHKKSCDEDFESRTVAYQSYCETCEPECG
ncbi:hypothetical protein [Stenotrophomonas sp. SPM]|uniref:hypothetical protein n=1 Tax=Stenotrophomonas sp. SPM TaxID=2170735 RepID=UPI0014021B9B|nr:hypothetical protein [Stenotrophomonas sp. SPM]